MYALLWFVLTNSTGATGTTEPAERVRRAANIGTDAKSLISYLDKAGGKDKELARIDDLIHRLASGAEEQARAQIVSLGAAALPGLRAARFADPDAARRLRECIQGIERSYAWAEQQSAVKVLLTHKEPETFAALLRFLPYTADEAVEEDIWFGLYALAKEQPKLRSELVKHLEDPLPSRRALAGFLLARLGDLQQRKAATQLLEDAQALVRLRVAQGMLGSKDRRGMPALLKLLPDPSLEVAWQAEELLRWSAGDDAPALTVGAGGSDARAKCRKAWTTWWDARGAEIDLAERFDKDFRRPGLFAACWFNQEKQASVAGVRLYGCDGVPRWELRGLKAPRDLQITPGPRVIVVESNAGSAEYELDGKVVWEQQSFGISCQRLPNGNTFLAGDSIVGEITSSGTRLYVHRTRPVAPPQLGESTCTRRRADDEIVFLLKYPTSASPWGLGTMDARTGQVTSKIDLKLPLPSRYTSGELLPHGHWLIALADRIVEVNRAGTVAKEILVAEPGTPAVLPTGKLLLPSGPSQGRIIEIDASAAKVVWEAFIEGNAHRLRPCMNLIRLGFDHPVSPEAELGSFSARVRELQSKNVLVRRGAAAALRDLGAKAAPASAALVRSLEDADDSVVLSSADALRNVGPPALGGLLDALRANNVRVKTHVAWILAHRGFREEAKRIAPVLIESAKTAVGPAKAALMAALGNMAPEASAVVPVIVRHLEDKDDEVRTRAFGALETLGHAAKPAVPVLLDYLNGKDLALRTRAAYYLGKIGAVDDRVIPALIGALHDKDPMMFAAAANAFRFVGPGGKAAVPHLLKAMELYPEKTPMLCSCLAGIREGAKDAVPTLLNMLEDKKQPARVRGGAALALGDIGDARPVAAFWEIAKDQTLDRDLRGAAILGLGKLRVREAIPFLIQLIKAGRSADYTARLSAVQALAEFGPQAKEAIPTLEEALRVESGSYTLRVIREALERIRTNR